MQLKRVFHFKLGLKCTTIYFQGMIFSIIKICAEYELSPLQGLNQGIYSESQAKTKEYFDFILDAGVGELS